MNPNNSVPDVGKEVMEIKHLVMHSVSAQCAACTACVRISSQFLFFFNLLFIALQVMKNLCLESGIEIKCKMKTEAVYTDSLNIFI